MTIGREMDSHTVKYYTVVKVNDLQLNKMNES